MGFSHSELKYILVKSFSNFTGSDIKTIENLIITSSEALDVPEVGEIVGLEGMPFLKYFADDIYVYLLNKDQSFRLFLIFGNQCQNIGDVQYYIQKYEKSKYSNVFSVVNDVTDAMDSLALEVNFDALSEEDSIDMLTFLFSVLTRKDFVECAYPMLRYFDRCSENIAI